MTQKDNILAIAAKEVGYRQAANGSNKYGQWYGMDKVAWCAIFVSWLAHQSGIDADIIPRFSYCPAGVDYFKKQGRFKAAKGYTPQAGDIVFYDFNGNGTADHVGIVTGYKSGIVYAIEGNTSSASQTNGGAVERKQRKISLVLGYGVPDWEEKMEIKTVKVKSLDTGSMIEVEAVNVNGSNYIKLRDIEKLVPVEIGWDGTSPTMNLKYK